VCAVIGKPKGMGMIINILNNRSYPLTLVPD